jgi:hypothetical protein
MLAYLKENGFPMSIWIESSDYKSEDGWKGYLSIVTDENGKEIDRIYHNEYHARANWAQGFFTALKMKQSEILGVDLPDPIEDK